MVFTPAFGKRMVTLAFALALPTSDLAEAELWWRNLLPTRRPKTPARLWRGCRWFTGRRRIHVRIDVKGFSP